MVHKLELEKIEIFSVWLCLKVLSITNECVLVYGLVSRRPRVSVCDYTGNVLAQFMGL